MLKALAHIYVTATLVGGVAALIIAIANPTPPRIIPSMIISGVISMKGRNRLTAIRWVPDSSCHRTVIS